MIVEKQLDTLDNKVVKVNKKPTPKSDNPNLTHMFFVLVCRGQKFRKNLWISKDAQKLRNVTNQR